MFPTDGFLKAQAKKTTKSGDYPCIERLNVPYIRKILRIGGGFFRRKANHSPIGSFLVFIFQTG